MKQRNCKKIIPSSTCVDFKLVVNHSTTSKKKLNKMKWSKCIKRDWSRTKIPQCLSIFHHTTRLKPRKRGDFIAIIVSKLLNILRELSPFITRELSANGAFSTCICKPFHPELRASLCRISTFWANSKFSRFKPWLYLFTPSRSRSPLTAFVTLSCSLVICSASSSYVSSWLVQIQALQRRL